MTDAQHLINLARTQFSEIAADVEKHFDSVTNSLRDRFLSTSLPSPRAKAIPPPTTWQSIERWVSKHKALSAGIAAFVVSGSVASAVYIHHSREGRRKRRARKAASGARTDVVVVAGAVANPLTSAIYLDLERRGFIVYVVASTAEDEHYVRAQSRADLVPLSLDLVDPYTAAEQVQRFRGMLGRTHHAFEGAEGHRLRFVGLVLVPDTQQAASFIDSSSGERVEDISSEEWSDALNAKVLNTIATTQLLLPAVLEYQAKIMLLTPSIMPALRLPGHSIESTVYGALKGFISSLAAEVKPDGISVSHFKLGNIDIPSVTAKQRREGVPSPRLKSTPLRSLNNAVFDELMAKRSSSTRHVGRGSITYDIIGNLMPPSFIAWMMGAGRRPTLVRDRSEESMMGSAGSLTWEKVDDETGIEMHENDA